MPPAIKPFFAHLREDLPASVVVFLVALPLCLGIALASGAPLLAGLLSGIIGGLVVGAFSRSPLSVSGPAAGLTVVVARGVAEVGSYPAFLTALVLAGALQIAFGYLRGGALARFVPAGVVRGMLAAIGCTLVLKQIPHALGRDTDYEGDESFDEGGGHNTFTELWDALVNVNLGALSIFLVALVALLVWQRFGRRVAGPWLPAALMAVLAGTGLNLLFAAVAPDLHVSGAAHTVAIPEVARLRDLAFALPAPDWSRVLDSTVWGVAITLALIASVETLLSVSATDKLDPQRRITPTDRELRAQGVGNLAAGLLGALPLTAVIVRSSANIDAGARTRLSAILHGVLLLASVLLLAPILNVIPLAALAAVLLVMGIKLFDLKVLRGYVARGTAQWVPYVVTLLAILLTDLLVGVLIGIGVGIFFVVRTNFRSAIVVTRDGDHVLIRFAKDVSFLNKPALMRAFEEIPEGAQVLIDGTRAQFIDDDIAEELREFVDTAPARGVTVSLRRSAASLNPYFMEKENPA